MSLVALEIPKIGLVMESARLVRWLKQVGEVVQQGEPLLELETEKSVVEIESIATGRLVEILLQPDQEVRVGDRVAWLENDPTATAPSATRAASATETMAAPDTAGSSRTPAGAPTSTTAAGPVGTAPLDASAHASAWLSTQPTDEHRAPAPNPTNTPTPARDGTQPPATGRLKSSPVARRLAAQHALDLRRITPTGPRGRIQLVDVRRAIESGTVQGLRDPGATHTQGTGAHNTDVQRTAPHGAAAHGTHAGALAAQGSPAHSTVREIAPSPAAAGPQPLSSMRRAVARAMTLSNATVPQFVVERAVDWSTLQRVRTQVLAELPSGTAKPSVNDFLLQAIARALLTHPQLNATFQGDPNSPDAALLPAHGTHIGLVVAVENGLLVPVLHEVERIGLMELASRRSETVQRALSGRLKREELEGATFSLSNLGARGPDRFTALISPPQSAILAVGRQRECVVALQGGIHVRPLSQLTLTVDHRVADGRLAADFLATLVDILEGDTWRVS